jgi:hypothetical protein
MFLDRSNHGKDECLLITGGMLARAGICEQGWHFAVQLMAGNSATSMKQT